MLGLLRSAIPQPDPAESVSPLGESVPAQHGRKNYLVSRIFITGSTDGLGRAAAGGCVLLASWRDARGGSRVLIVAAVLGQPGTGVTILPNALGAGYHLMLGLGQALQPGSRQRARHNR